MDSDYYQGISEVYGISMAKIKNIWKRIGHSCIDRDDFSNDSRQERKFVNFFQFIEWHSLH